LAEYTGKEAPPAYAFAFHQKGKVLNSSDFTIRPRISKAHEAEDGGEVSSPKTIASPSCDTETSAPPGSPLYDLPITMEEFELSVKDETVMQCFASQLCGMNAGNIKGFMGPDSKTDSYLLKRDYHSAFHADSIDLATWQYNADLCESYSGYSDPNLFLYR
jgi:hypothetical protein